MDTYQASSWEPSHTFHMSDNFESVLSNVSNWETPMDGPWHQLPAIRDMEDPRFMVGGYVLEDSKPSKQDDVFHLPSIPEEDPQACSLSDISTPRSSPASSPLSSPVSCTPSASSPASVASVPLMDPRVATPEYCADGFYPVKGEPSRAEIKENPTEFINSTFTHQQSQLRDRLWDITCSQWWLEGTLEPRGHLSLFIRRLNSKTFECLSCGKKLPRSDRAVDHFRTHIYHRPYHCKGSCGDRSCKMAFYTRDCMKSHRAKHEKTCSRCGTTLEDKNLIRHLGTAKCKNFRK